MKTLQNYNEQKNLSIFQRLFGRYHIKEKLSRMAKNIYQICYIKDVLLYCLSVGQNPKKLAKTSKHYLTASKFSSPRFLAP